MWISRKKYQELEKRIADLEKNVQSQQMLMEYLRINISPPVSIIRSNCSSTWNNVSNYPCGGGLS